MSQRPKLWIHRTRPFWFGLGALVALTVITFVSCCIHFNVRHEARTTPAGRRAHFIVHRIGFQEGGAYLERTAGGSGWFGGGGSGWSRWLNEHYGFRWLPSVSWDEWKNGEQHVFVPFWPLIVLWCVLWPWWMHRSEKRMLERYRKMGGGPECD